MTDPSINARFLCIFFSSLFHCRILFLGAPLSFVARVKSVRRVMKLRYSITDLFFFSSCGALARVPARFVIFRTLGTRSDDDLVSDLIMRNLFPFFGCCPSPQRSFYFLFFFPVSLSFGIARKRKKRRHFD